LFGFPQASLLKLDDEDCLLQECKLGTNPKYRVTIKKGSLVTTFELINYLYPEIYLSFQDIQLGDFLNNYRDKILPLSSSKQKSL
jgi:hypothetical protein